MRRLGQLLQLIGVAHSRCPLAEAVAVAVQERLDDRATRRHINSCRTAEALERAYAEPEVAGRWRG